MESITGAEPSADVIVVGGGIAGLSASLFLARRGVPVTLIERHPSTAVLPQARAFNPRTMEIYRSLGLAERIRAHTSVLADRPEMLGAATLGGPERFRVDLLAQVRPPEGVSPAQWCMIDQDELERVIRAEAETAGARVLFGHECVSVDQSADGVLARVRTPDGDRTLPAQWLIAADGHRSTVRESLGIGQQGPGALFDVIYFLFEADLRSVVGDRRFLLAYLDQPRPGTTLVPAQQTGRWSLGVPFPPGQRPSDIDEAQCVEFARAAVGDPDLDVTLVPPVLGWPTLISHSTVGGWVADRYRSGRVLIAGDAAHVVPPAGSFGANTAIADVHNVAWKLAAVLAGDAGHELIDTYEAERRPVARRTLAASMALMQDRHSADADVIDQLDEISLMFGYSYEPNWDGVPADPRMPSGRPGLRAPHVPLRRAGREVSSLDLIGDGLTLLCGHRAESWSAEASRAVARTGVPLTAVRIGVDVEDPQALFEKSFGVGAESASLVRPDGFVAWRSAGPPGATGGELAAAVDALLCRSAQGPVTS